MNDGNGNGQALIDVARIALTAHTTGAENRVELKLHREECATTRIRNEQMFARTSTDIQEVRNRVGDILPAVTTQINEMMPKIETKIDERMNKVIKKNEASNRNLGLILITLTIIAAIVAKVPINIHL